MQQFKGDDDLRQDAVMEQVFELVNVVLKRDRETKRRALSVRGYKVVPLGPQAGVLEFVGNTTSLQQWLSKAHQRYVHLLHFPRPSRLNIPSDTERKASPLGCKSKKRYPMSRPKTDAHRDGALKW